MPNTGAFYDRIDRLGITPADLNNHLEISPGAFVVGYTSQIDGFGTDTSDLDIYVCSSSITVRRVETIIVGETSVDVEYTPVSNIEHLLALMEAVDIDDPDSQGNLVWPEQLKQLYRLAVGAVLQKGPEDLRKRISLPRLQAMFVRCMRHGLDDTAEDTLRLFEAGDHLAAVHFGRKAFDHVALAYLAKEGFMVFKTKWLYRALTQCLGVEHPIHKAFTKYHFSAVDSLNARPLAEEILRNCEKFGSRLG